MDNKIKIFVIDDEFGIREGCRRVLEPEGYEVALASTIQQGRASIEENSYDLILLDVMMPDGRGIDLLEDLKSKDPDTIVVIITGYATVELAVEAIKEGAYDFISKPFTSDVLLMTVRQGLEKRKLSLEAKRLQKIEQEAAELARAKDEMERLDEFKTVYTTMVAHELRAPVTALQSFLLSMLKGYVPEDQQKEILARAVDRVHELLDLVNDLLNLAAVREELAASKHALIHLVEMLHKVLPLFKVQAEEKGIELEINVQGNPEVRANEDQMVQVWTNLISNAIKYTPEHGRVSVSLEERDGWAIGQVKDTGIGIAPEHQEKIFSDFYRTPEAKEFSRLGTGLGLTLVKKVIEAHAGTIGFESESGKGTAFRFRLPIDNKKKTRG